MTHQEIKELAGHRAVSPWIMKLVGDAVAKELEACESIEYDLAKSPAMFATMAEYKAYRDGVQDYRKKIIARGKT